MRNTDNAERTSLDQLEDSIHENIENPELIAMYERRRSLLALEAEYLAAARKCRDEAEEIFIDTVIKHCYKEMC